MTPRTRKVIRVPVATRTVNNAIVTTPTPNCQPFVAAVADQSTSVSDSRTVPIVRCALDAAKPETHDARMPVKNVIHTVVLKFAAKPSAGWRIRLTNT
jgi:hypothetical protein